MRTLQRLTAVTCAALLGCGGPEVQSGAARAVLHEGARNDALRSASAKYGVPLELLMAVGVHQGRFELPPATEQEIDEGEPDAPAALETVSPPAVEDEAMPELDAVDPEAPAGLDDEALPADPSDVGLQTELMADTEADDAEAVSDPVSEAAENASGQGDAHADVELFGVMYLTPEQVAHASLLTGLPELQIRTEVGANVEAAAALLQSYAVAAGVDVASADPSAWAPALAKLIGADDDVEVASLAVRALNDLYADGFDFLTSDGERLQLEGLGRDVASAQQELTPGKYPPIEFISAASSNYGTRQGGKVRFVVIHDMEGTMAGTIATFRNPGRQASAHYVLRARDGKVVQMVKESMSAWHAGHSWFNHNSIGIEHEGFANKPNGGGYYNSTQYNASAGLVCAIAKKYKIPVDRKHIFGHGNVPSSLSSHTLCSDANANAGRCGGASHHHDPGKYWNWSNYMKLVARCVNGVAPPAPQPPKPPTSSGTTVKGVITKGTSTTRLSGVTVRIGTKSATSNAEGYYELKGIPSGSRTITASKSGYVTKSITRAVSGSETWGSLGLAVKPAAGTASLIGVVERGNGARVAGAKVTLSNGRSTTTNADGVYKLGAMPAGTVTITATKSGIGTAKVTRTLQSGKEVWGSVKL